MHPLLRQQQMLLRLLLSGALLLQLLPLAFLFRFAHTFLLRIYFILILNRGGWEGKTNKGRVRKTMR